jgi:hypothetical protein
MRNPLLVMAVLLLPGGSSADELFLKSGGRLSGRIVTRTATEVTIDIGAGRITVPTSSVTRIQDGRSTLHEYEDRAGRIPAGDVNAWLALGDWASAAGLGTQASEAYHRALAAAPDNARANQALGRVQSGGRWLSQEESYQERGYVRFEGEWMTLAEQQAILSQRAAEGEQERVRREADQRVREAEARAEEAEQRAKEAQAKADEPEGLPLWYGWGAGPVAWPTGPIVTRPAQPNTPAWRSPR